MKKFLLAVGLSLGLWVAPAARESIGVVYTDIANVFTADQRVNAGVGINVAPGATGTLSLSDGIFERSRAAKMGDWTSVAYSSGNFTAGGSQTWTVASGDVNSYTYSLVGHTMQLDFQAVTTSIGGTPNPELRLAIPGGFTLDHAFTFPGFTVKNSASSTLHESLLVNGGGAGVSYISLYLLGAPNWPATTDATNIYVKVAFQVQ